MNVGNWKVDSLVIGNKDHSSAAHDTTNFNEKKEKEK